MCAIKCVAMKSLIMKPMLETKDIVSYSFYRLFFKMENSGEKNHRYLIVFS